MGTPSPEPFCLSSFPRPGLLAGRLESDGWPRARVSLVPQPDPVTARGPRAVRPAAARVGRAGLGGGGWGPPLAAGIACSRGCRPAAERRKLPALPLPAAATRALRGQFRDPRPAAKGIPARVSGTEPQSPGPGRESPPPGAGNGRAGRRFLGREWSLTLELPWVGAGVGWGAELGFGEEGGSPGAGGPRTPETPPAASGPVRLGLGVCGASRSFCHRLFLVTNSRPRGTQRLRPRETG